MTQYIDKSALVAEIKRRININETCQKISGGHEFYRGAIDEAKEILSFLDTLEVKEVDLENSIKETLAQKYIDYTFRRYNIDPDSKEGQLIYYAYMHGINQCLNQLKAQKGEEV